MITAPATGASRPWEDDLVAGDLQTQADEARHQMALWEADAITAETHREALDARRQYRRWAATVERLELQQLYMTESRGTA